MAAHSTHTSDVLIIGGGIIGCALAWRLAQAGMNVTVLDRGEPGAEASSAAAGMLAPIGEMLEPPEFSALCVASRELYPRFAAEIEAAAGDPVGYRAEGSLLVALDARQEAELARIHAAQAARGHVLKPLDAAEVVRRVPHLAPEIRRGLFIPEDHWIDNEQLMRALLVACRHAGVRIEPRRAAQRLHRRSDRIEGVTATGDFHFTAHTFVLAAGCWSGEVVGQAQAPLVPCLGQMMEFETECELPCVVRAGLHYLVPRPGRRLLAGTTAEYRGFTKSVTAAGLLSVLAGVVRLAPFVGECRFRRAWAGLRPDTPDHLPLLGYGEFANLLFATGHFRNGILLAPITAEILSRLILKGSTPWPLEAYRPTRFAAASKAGGNGQAP
jgi:glycine oxidase